MANIKSINGNPIVLDANGIEERSIAGDNIATETVALDNLTDYVNALIRGYGIDYDLLPMTKGYRRFLPCSWEYGSISYSSGGNSGDTVSIRTPLSEKISLSGPVKFIIGGIYRLRWAVYSSDGTYESNVGWRTGTQTLTPDSSKLYRLHIATTNGSAINLEDAINTVLIAYEDETYVEPITYSAISFGNKSDVTFGRNGTTLRVTFAAGMHLYANDNTGKVYQYTFADETSFDIANPYTLLWDLTANTISLVNSDATRATKTIPLLRNVYRNVPSGALKPFYDEWLLTSMMLKHEYGNGIIIASKGGEGLGVPPNSLVSVKAAYDNGYDAYRANICVTSDGYLVLSHNRSINAIARNTDGSEISTTINIDEHTLEELNQYDYGIQYGTQYAGMGITTFEQCVKIASKLGLRLDIEPKYGEVDTKSFFETVYETIVSNGYSNKNWHWIAGSQSIMDIMMDVCDYVDIEVYVTATDINWANIEHAKSANHNVLVGYTGEISSQDMLLLKKMNVMQNKGTASTISALVAQIESGVYELEANFRNPRQALIDYAKSITFSS